MKMHPRRGTRLLPAALAITTAVTGIGTAHADFRSSDRSQERPPLGTVRSDAHPPNRYQERGPLGTLPAESRRPVARRHDYVMHRGRPYNVPPDRVYRYRNVIVVRPYGHRYPGYGHYRSDASAYKWLAFTAITLAILNNMNEAQQRAYEQAQVRATTAPVGEKIIWNNGGASGSVTTIRDGVSTAGRYCREFQQTVTIGGKTQQAYGTACRQPDGSWEVVSTGSEP
jgi:hypothetical protein